MIIAAAAIAEMIGFPILRRIRYDAAKTKTVGNLALLRGALQSYRKANGKYPADLFHSIGQFAPAIPSAEVPPFHDPSAAVRLGIHADDGGGWLYDDVAGDPNFGTIWINCTHTDAKIGGAWASY